MKYGPRMPTLMLIGFLVNPIAGIGGRVGLKGSDNVEEEARRRGGKEVSPARAREALAAVASQLGQSIQKLRFLTCSGAMGESEMVAAGIDRSLFEVVYRPESPSRAKDTEKASKKFAEKKADLILFCGGDGTARDIVGAVGTTVPVLGIPSGVKMHSGVFCTRPESLGLLLRGFLDGRVSAGEAEVLDLDEEAYRRGEWSVRLFGNALTLVEPNLVQSGKMMVSEVADEAIKEEMAEYLEEMMEKEPEALFILGPGSTIAFMAKKLGIDKTLLGIDAVAGGKLVGKDLNEKGLLNLLMRHESAKLIVSPIGSQGFVLGRGNLQLSPLVIRRIGLQNILVFATPSKLQVTPNLRVDTGDPDLDGKFGEKEYLVVIIGYRTMRMHPLQV